MTSPVYPMNRGTGKGEIAHRIDADRFRVPSFESRRDGFFYEVDLSTLGCTCPRQTNGHRACVKHVVLADALEHLEGPGRYRSARTEARRRDLREDVQDLVIRVFKPVTKKDHPVDSYMLLLRALSTDTTGAVRTAARIRHSMILDGQTGRIA